MFGVAFNQSHIAYNSPKHAYVDNSSIFRRIKIYIRNFFTSTPVSSVPISKGFEATMSLKDRLVYRLDTGPRLSENDFQYWAAHTKEQLSNPDKSVSDVESLANTRHEINSLNCARKVDLPDSQYVGDFLFADRGNVDSVLKDVALKDGQTKVKMPVVLEASWPSEQTTVYLEFDKGSNTIKYLDPNGMSIADCADRKLLGRQETLGDLVDKFSDKCRGFSDNGKAPEIKEVSLDQERELNNQSSSLVVFHEMAKGCFENMDAHGAIIAAHDPVNVESLKNEYRAKHRAMQSEFDAREEIKEDISPYVKDAIFEGRAGSAIQKAIGELGNKNLSLSMVTPITRNRATAEVLMAIGIYNRALEAVNKAEGRVSGLWKRGNTMSQQLGNGQNSQKLQQKLLDLRVAYGEAKEDYRLAYNEYKKAEEELVEVTLLAAEEPSKEKRDEARAIKADDYRMRQESILRAWGDRGGMSTKDLLKDWDKEYPDSLVKKNEGKQVRFQEDEALVKSLRQIRAVRVTEKLELAAVRKLVIEEVNRSGQILMGVDIERVVENVHANVMKGEEDVFADINPATWSVIAQVKGGVTRKAVEMEVLTLLGAKPSRKSEVPKAIIATIEKVSENITTIKGNGNFVETLAAIQEAKEALVRASQLGGEEGEAMAKDIVEGLNAEIDASIEGKLEGRRIAAEREATAAETVGLDSEGLVDNLKELVRTAAVNTEKTVLKKDTRGAEEDL